MRGEWKCGLEADIWRTIPKYKLTTNTLGGYFTNNRNTVDMAVSNALTGTLLLKLYMFMYTYQREELKMLTSIIICNIGVKIIEVSNE